jgi:hypothetical protein
MNKEVEKLEHLLFVPDDQVNLPTLELNGQTIPAVKWYVFLLGHRSRYDMLPHDPKPAGHSSESNRLYFMKLETARRLLITKWIIVSQLSGQVVRVDLILVFDQTGVGFEDKLVPCVRLTVNNVHS